MPLHGGPQRKGFSQSNASKADEKVQLPILEEAMHPKTRESTGSTMSILQPALAAVRYARSTRLRTVFVLSLIGYQHNRRGSVRSRASTF